MSALASGMLLIDLENMIGNKAKPATLSSRLDALTGQAGPGVPAVAACAASRITADGIKILKSRGIRLIRVDGTKNAADEALLAEARREAAAGCRRFVVASNDSSFGEIADLGQLEIVIWQTQKPRAKNYAARAANVYRLPIPGTPAAPLPARPAALGAAPRRPATPGTVQPARQAPGPPAKEMDPARLAALGAGIVATGLLFGAGTVAGAVAARSLLRWVDSPSGHSSGT